MEDGLVKVKGPKGELSTPMVDDLSYELGDGGLMVSPANKSKQARSYWGMQRTLVQNLVDGVTEGFSKVLEINGVGYRAAVKGKVLNLQLGFSHDVDIDIPEGIDVKTPDQTTVEISGIDKQQVGQFAAEIRQWRKPEPYKGKGIKYRGEYIFPQRREEEISHGEIFLNSNGASKRVSQQIAEARAHKASFVRASYKPAYLCAGYR